MPARSQNPCTRCDTRHPRTREFFGAHKGRHDGLASLCKDCSRKMDRARYSGSRADAQRLRRIKYQPHKTDEAKAYIADWRRRNKLKCVAYSAKRRAKIAQSETHFTESDVLKAKLAQRGKCWWCSETLTSFEVDHRIAIANGGSNGPENIVISCPPCNRIKGTRMPWEFKEGRLL